MANVLLAWELGGGAGHCARLAPIAHGLIEKGHDVSIAARDLVATRHILGSAPVTYFQAPYLARASSNAPARSFADILANTGFGEVASLEVLCAAWRSVFTASKPDAIIFDHAPIALLASRWVSSRRIVVGNGFTVVPFLSPLPDLRYWLPVTGDASEELRQVEEGVLRRTNVLLLKDGLSTLDCLADLYASIDRCFLLTFAELDHYPGRQATRYWGNWPMSGGSTPEWPAKRPRLFAYLKPPTPEWNLAGFLSFLRESQLSSVVYIAGANPGWQRKFQTARLSFVAKPVDLTYAAQQCDIAVLNGTTGSVTTLLLAGIPQLNIPLYLEQLIVSRRVADLGAGLYADPSRPEQIVARLMAMLQIDRYREAAKTFSQRYADFSPQSSKDQVVSAIHEELLQSDSAGRI